MSGNLYVVGVVGDELAVDRTIWRELDELGGCLPDVEGCPSVAGASRLEAVNT